MLAGRKAVLHRFERHHRQIEQSIALQSYGCSTANATTRYAESCVSYS
jgi:hypothetical protein